MGKGVIVSHLGDAHYRIGLDIDVSYARNQLAAIQTYLDGFAPKYAEATEAKDAARAALTPINDRLTDYLAAGQAASQAAYDAMIAAYEEYADAVQNLPDQEMVQAAQDDADEVSGTFAANPNDETALDTLAADSLWQSLVGDFLDAAAVQAATDAKNAAISDLVTAQQEFDLGNIPEEALTFFQQNYATLRGDWLTVVSENSGPARVSTLEGQWQAATEAFDTARKDLGKLLGSGGLPEELAGILADQEKAYADYHAALQNWQSMTLIKAEKEKLQAELQSRLLPYTDNDGEPIRQEVNAWCCDATEDLSPGAEVATIEIPGERDLAVRVRPGYESRETYSAERDGLLQPSWASSPEATYWNWALHPGNAKWNPNYRLGEILLIDAQAGTCTVQLDQQTNNAKSRARDGGVLDVNNPITYQIDPDTGEQTAILPGDNVIVDSGITTLTDVEIEYMECNADAFEVGDHVMVEFQGRDWTAPKVIGFAESPRPCFVHGVAMVGVTGEGDQDGVLIPTHAHGVAPRLRHPAGVVNGDNIDWTSTDGKTVLTYNGPRGRLIAQRLEAPFVRIVGPNEYIARTYDAETQNFATDTLMTQPFGRVMYLNGKLAGTAPEDRKILGGAVLTHTAGGVTTRWLVAAMTGRYWSTTDYVASMQTYRDTITPNNAGRAVNPLLKLHVLAYAKYTGAAITETGWTVLDSQDFADDFSILPPLHNYFFSGSGAKFITLIPTVTRNGIGNPTIRRGTLGCDANSVWLESDAITAQERVPGMRTYIQQDVQTYTTGTSFTSISATCQEQAIVAADFIGEEEVTLEVTVSEFSDLTQNGSNTAWYDNLLTSSSSGSGSSSITWTLTDTHRNQTVGSMSASTSYGSNSNYAWDGGYSSSFYSTSDGSLEQPLFYDLRNGASIIETSTTRYDRSNDVSITFGQTNTGTASASFLRTVSQSLRDHLGTTLWQDSQSHSDGYSEDNPEPPLMAPHVNVDEFTVTDYYGISAHRWASMHWWVDDYTGFGDPLWVAPVYYIQPTNADGDSVLRMEIGFYPSFGGYEIFPDESRIMLRFPDSTLFTRFEPRSINMAYATGFDLSQAWQDHLRDKHSNEEENYPDAVTSNLTPYFKV